MPKIFTFLLVFFFFTSSNFAKVSVENSPKDQIYITEIFAAPENGENEWVEIFYDGKNQFEVKDWFLDDVLEGGSKPKKFSTKLKPNSFYVINLTASVLNNSGDTVNLLDASKNVVLQVKYGKTEKGKSWVRDLQGNWNIYKPTKGIDNSSKVVSENIEVEKDFRVEEAKVLGKSTDNSKSDLVENLDSNSLDTKNDYNKLKESNITVEEKEDRTIVYLNGKPKNLWQRFWDWLLK